MPISSGTRSRAPAVPAESAAASRRRICDAKLTSDETLSHIWNLIEAAK